MCRKVKWRECHEILKCYTTSGTLLTIQPNNHYSEEWQDDMYMQDIMGENAILRDRSRRKVRGPTPIRAEHGLWTKGRRA